MSHNAQLKSFVERIERIEEEIKACNDDKRDLYAEAKSSGFDVPALKAVIAKRRKDPAKLSEFEALVETYEAALGTGNAPRARVHEAPPVGGKITTQPLATEDPHALPEFLDRRKLANA